MLQSQLTYIHKGHPERETNEQINEIFARFPENLRDKVRLERFSTNVQKFS
jgi:hypothetical protein